MSKSWTPRNSQTSSNQHPDFFRLSPSVFWIRQSCVASPEVFMSLAKDLRQRKDCECTRSTDIGQYTLQCPHGCALGKNPENLGDRRFFFFFGRNMGIKVEIRDFTATNRILPTTMGILSTTQNWDFTIQSGALAWFNDSPYCLAIYGVVPYFVLPSPANGMMISSDFHMFGMVEGNADGYLAKMFFFVYWKYVTDGWKHRFGKGMWDAWSCSTDSPSFPTCGMLGGIRSECTHAIWKKHHG